MKLILLKIYKVLPVKVRFFISYFLTDKFVVGMIAFVVKDKKLLLMKHSYQYSWALPGGWMKRGEDLVSTMEREIKEEIGLKVKVINISEVKSIKTRPVIDVVVICKVITGEIAEDKIEVEKAQFFPFNSLPKDIIHTHLPYINAFLEKN